MSAEAFGSHEDWKRYRAAHDTGLREQAREEARLLQELTADGLRGECVLCGTARRFLAPGASAQSPASLSLRESLTCEGCNANARQRATAQVLFDSAEIGRANVYITEQTSDMYLQLARHCRRLTGSEFVRDWRRRLRLMLWLVRRGRPQWLRGEDVTALSFGDAAFDAILSLDVLEHVPDYARGLAEFARVLRPGGVLVFTVPFYDAQSESTVLARIGDDGRIEHLQPPEYHGDPVSSGALCFHHFGWNLLDALRSAGFSTAEALRVRAPASGIPQALWVLRATR
ncbi:MAG: class I SAM-dependent methyltransferase [Luteimonas sp.]